MKPYCRESEKGIADEVLRSRNLMQRQGTAESYLSILQHVGSTIPATDGKLDCRSFFAAYMTLRAP
jgi:hypothetical protein